MFSRIIKSKKGILFAVGSAGILILTAIFVSFSPFYSQNSAFEQATIDKQEPKVFYVDRCHETPAVSIIYTQGFVTVKPLTLGTPPLTQEIPASNQRLGVYEFVLKPGSTGYIFTTYDFCPDWTNSGSREPIYRNSSMEVAELLNPMNHEIFKFKDKVLSSSSVTSNDPLGSMLTSNNPSDRFGASVPPENITDVKISPSNITRINDQSVKVTYVVTATDNAQRATYGINIYGTCIGEILTIGDEPNENSMALESVKGPFYGCT